MPMSSRPRVRHLLTFGVCKQSVKNSSENDHSALQMQHAAISGFRCCVLAWGFHPLLLSTVRLVTHSTGMKLYYCQILNGGSLSVRMHNLCFGTVLHSCALMTPSGHFPCHVFEWTNIWMAAVTLLLELLLMPTCSGDPGASKRMATALI